MKSVAAHCLGLFEAGLRSGSSWVAWFRDLLVPAVVRLLLGWPGRARSVLVCAGLVLPGLSGSRLPGFYTSIS